LASLSTMNGLTTNGGAGDGCSAAARNARGSAYFFTSLACVWADSSAER
jgi:hypothetical protein